MSDRDIRNPGEMNKKGGVAFAIFLSLLLSFFSAQTSHAGLFGPSADTKKNVATIKKLAVTETRLLNRYNAVTGANYKDDYTTGYALIDLLPDVNNFINRLESLSPQDAKLQAAVNLWVDGWNKQAEGISLCIDAIDKQDYSVMARANAKLSEGRKILRRANQALSPFLK